MTTVALDELLAEALAAIRTALDADSASVLVANEEGNRLVARGSVGLLEDISPDLDIPAGAGMAGRVIAMRAPIVVENLDEIELASPLLKDSGLKSVVAVPILSDETVLGVLHVGSRDRGHFVAADAEVLSLVADRLATAMWRVTLFESERDAREQAELMAERLGRLQRITAALSADLDDDNIADLICREVTPDLGGGLTSCTLWMRRGDVLRLIRPEDAPAATRQYQEIPLDADLPGPEVVRTGRALWIASRAETHRRYPALLDTPFRSDRLAILPLRVKGEVLGALALGFEGEGRFELHQRAFFLAVTEQAAQAFDRSRLRRLEARFVSDNAFVAEASAVLQGSLDYAETLTRTVKLLVPRVADLASIHLFTERDQLRRVALAHHDPAVEQAIIAAGPDVGPAALLGRIAEGETLLVADAPAALSSPDPITREAAEALAPLNLSSALLVPLGPPGERLGVLSLAQVGAARAFDPLDAALAEAVAERAAVAIANSRLHSELSAAQRAERFLLDVANALARASGYEETLGHLGRVAVPTLGDLCLIDVVDEDGRLRRMVAHHADADKQPFADELGLYAPDPFGRHPSVEVLRTRHSIWASEMSDQFLRETCLDERHYEIVKALDFTSFMTVPFGTGDTTLGSLTLVSAGSGRRFDERDLALAEELAEQVASVVDKARRYELERLTSHILQSSLLPNSLPQLADVQLCVRYLPGTRDIEVGGDFYDAVALPNGHLGLVIGDVAGHDRAAAAMMGNLRSAARALSGQLNGPVEVVRALQDRWEFLGFELFATALVCELDPATGDLAVVSAGHPPPLLLHETSVEFLPVRPSSPLGVPGREPEAWRGRLQPGEVLLMYTDGVIEDRESDLETQMAKLAGIASGSGRDTAEVCDRVLADIGADRPDDIALLAVGR